MDGSAEITCHHVRPPVEGQTYVYPVHFRIPPCSIKDLLKEDQVKRAESFAWGTLLYMVFAGKEPFDGLIDSEVQSRFANADLPQNMLDISALPIILSCWSHEFATMLQSLAGKIFYAPAIFLLIETQEKEAIGYLTI